MSEASPADAAGVDHHRPGHRHHLEVLIERLPDQRGGLADGGLHLALRRDAVGHEGEGQAVALLGFGDHADAAQPDHDGVALAEIAQAPAGGLAVADHDHGVHALVLDLDPLLAVSHVGAVIGGGVEILRRAAVPLHLAEHGVAGGHGRAAQLEQRRQQAVERLRVRRFHPHAEVRRFAVGASDAELIHFEPAVKLYDFVEGVLHDVRIDQVAFSLDDFLEWHRRYQCSFLTRTGGGRGSCRRRSFDRRSARGIGQAEDRS